MASGQQHEALLEKGGMNPAPEGNREAAGSSWPTIAGFAFLTFNSAMAVYQSNRAMGATVFVAFSFLDLLVLFYCLRLHNRAPPGSLPRENLKMAGWLLTTMLTYSVFVLLEFWFSSMREGGAKIS